MSETMGNATSSKSDRRPQPGKLIGSGEILSLDEVSEHYPIEWVALKVTRLDDEGAISHGEVLTHSPHRGKLNKVVKQALQGDPAAHVCIYFGGLRRVSGDEFRRLMEQAMESDTYVHARWGPLR